MDTSYSSSLNAGQTAGLAAFGLVYTVFWLVILVLMIAALWRVFTKAGEAGWKAIIPIYNVIVLLQIVGRPLWWIILLFIPLVNIVILIIVYNDLSKSFGHGVGFTLGLIFLSVIFLPILGFGKSTYIGRGGVPAYAAAPAGGGYAPPAGGGYAPPAAPSYTPPAPPYSPPAPPTQPPAPPSQPPTQPPAPPTQPPMPPRV